EAKSATPLKRTDLRILRAAYGYFAPEAPAWIDVTKKVQSLAVGGINLIPANNDFAGDDPAPDIPKQLRVEYALNGGDKTLEVGEGKSLTVPRSATVIKAIYGALDMTNRSVDLTEKLESLVKEGRLIARANNTLAGGDPADLAPKELRVDYSLNGVVKRVTVPENQMLVLPPEFSIGQAPQFEVRVEADGPPIVKLWGNGKVVLMSADGRMLSADATDLPAPQEIAGSWNLSFPPSWGAPPSVTLDKLISWTDSTNEGVRYFSGTATYEKKINVPADRLASGRELWLDLGDVKDFAEVSLNGHDYGILWKPPFRVNATDAARPGMNTLIVKVTNLWPNRLIGDEQLPPDREWTGKHLAAWPQWLLEGKPSPTGRFTFTTWHHYTKNSPLLESGLLGPVRLETVENITPM
ncbi:MAG: glycosylhydrolase-like jelly roll fold domain-containing protein, partial [Limisphaerales bacterium]